MFDHIPYSCFDNPLRAITTKLALDKARKKAEDALRDTCDPYGCHGGEATIEEFGKPVGEVYYDRRGSAEIEFGFEFYDANVNVAWIKGRYDSEPQRLEAEFDYMDEF